MTRVLLMTLVFSPDGVSTSVLMTELARRLRAAGHDLTVLTTTPHYNVDAEAAARQPLHRRVPWLYESRCDGIPVFHVSMPRKADRVGARALDYVWFHAVSTALGLVMSFDVILAPSPPLTIGLSAWLLGMIRNKPFVYNVQEIYPDVAVRLGVLRNRYVIRAMELCERFIYSRANAVTVISEQFRERLLAKGVSSDKLHVISNFVDSGTIRPLPRRNAFSATHGLDDAFVVLYAGNIGLTQSMETLLDAADRVRDLRDVVFVVVGDGARRNWLAEQIAQRSADNVLLLPFQPWSDVPNMYASSDVCLVPLKRGMAMDTFPSKVYTVMSAGRPVVAGADEGSELRAIPQRVGCGWSLPPDDADALEGAVREAYANPLRLEEMGRRGREYVEGFHSPEVIAAQYDALISELARA